MSAPATATMREMEIAPTQEPRRAPVAPEWIELLPAPNAEGMIVGRDGRRFRVSDPRALVAAINRANADRRIAGDYEHASEILAPEGHPAPAVGWVQEVRATPAGAIEARIDWTPRGRQSVESYEYRYVSPTILYDKDSAEVVGISSWALTNQQNLRNRALFREQTTQSIMNPDQLKQLHAALGLPEGSTPEATIAAAAKTRTDLSAALNRESTPSLERFVPRADYDRALNRANQAEATLRQQAEAAREAEITAVIERAMQSGKITPATKEFYVATCRAEGGLDRFKSFISTAPTIGDPAPIPATPPTSTATLDASERALCRQLGLAEQDYLKTKQAQATA